MVWFTVHVRNFENTALSLSGFVEDGNGTVIKRIDGFEGRIPTNGEKNITFSYTVYGVGNHTFKLFLDNYDGKPNGKGEEHWSKTTVEVKPVNGTELKQVGFECDDPEFNWNRGEYTATLVCKAFVYNPAQNSVGISIVSVKEWSVNNRDLKDALEHAWVVKYPEAINASKIGVITFENTAHTGLGTLEYDLFGANVLVALNYTISPKSGDDVTFVGTDIISIKQDDKDVIGDVGVNVGVTIVLGELVELPRTAKLAWDFIGPIVIGKIKNKVLG